MWGQRHDTIAMVDEGDVHCMMIGAAAGKQPSLYQPRFACACGMSFLTTDTRAILWGTTKHRQRMYGYNVALIDLRWQDQTGTSPHLVNKHMDEYLMIKNIKQRQKIQRSPPDHCQADGDNANYGQTHFSMSWGLLTVISCWCRCVEEQRHIHRYQADSDLPAQWREGKINSALMERLPMSIKPSGSPVPDTGDQAMQSVMSQRSPGWIPSDSELEQILCFDTAIGESSVVRIRRVRGHAGGRPQQILHD